MQTFICVKILLKRFPEAMIVHLKHGILSLNEKITKSTLLKMFCAVMFLLDWNPFKLWAKLQFKFLVQFSAMKTPVLKSVFTNVTGL